MSKEGDVSIIRMLVINEISFSIKLSEENLKASIEKRDTSRVPRELSTRQ